MKPEDILHAIGEVDDVCIRKAHQKSLFRAILVFLIIAAIGIAVVYSLLTDYHLQLRYNPDGSVITEYVEPEVIIHNKWTSMEYTAYSSDIPVSSTRFQRKFAPDYRIIHNENGTETIITGSNGDTKWPSDYLGSVHYTNLYIRTMYSTDLLDRIDFIFINSEAAYGTLNQQLNCIKLEYFERSDRVHRQYLVENGRTPEEKVIRSRGYSYSNGQLSGWQEWNADGILLTYAQYLYDGNTQTVSTFLADNTPTGTRVSNYTWGKLRWREYYDTAGNLTGREVYHYRFWEPFLCLPGYAALMIIFSLAATFAIAIWDERLKLGDRLTIRKVSPTQEEITLLIRKTEELNDRVSALSNQLSTSDQQELREEISSLQAALEDMNARLSALMDRKLKDA